MTTGPESTARPFVTDLWLPAYRDGCWGDWSLRTTYLPGARGYWGALYGLFETAILTGPVRGDEETWMSIVPMEVESQEVGIAAAHGHTAVLGLGMGWAAANVALNPAVDRVTVVERDPDVIALITALGVFDQLPAAARDKIAIVAADAFDWRPDAAVDSLQADIWAKVVEPGKWDEVHRLQANIGAASLYFWGQEMELYRLACREAGAMPEALGDADVVRLAERIGLPLAWATGSPPARDTGHRGMTGGGTVDPLLPSGLREGSGEGLSPCSCALRNKPSPSPPASGRGN